jgi:hypothetical protein
MLPKILIDNQCYRGPQDEDWLKYLTRIEDYAHKIDRAFLSDVCFGQGERFNEYFPKFDLRKHKILRRRVTAAEIQANVRYDYNQPMNHWGWQIDDYLDSKNKFNLTGRMVSELTWPFPPTIIDNTNGFADSLSLRSLGSPWHLIEGTHRISYLNRMLDLKMVAPDSEHEILWLVDAHSES